MPLSKATLRDILPNAQYSLDWTPSRPAACLIVAYPSLSAIGGAFETTLTTEAASMVDHSRFPTTPNELIFPSACQNISSTIATLRRSALSPHNRLCSILHDSEFVTRIASTHKLPLIANERCGSWYIPPSTKAGSAYFKSTDGHTGQVAFSCRRLNLHLLDTIGELGGYATVDSICWNSTRADTLGFC